MPTNTYWNDAFLLNVPSIDSQHKNLFDLSYQLDQGIDSGKEVNNSFLIEQLQQYCQYHFISEEQMMHEIGYEGLHAHIAQHDDFTRNILEFQQQFEAEDPALAHQVAHFLRKWLTAHIAAEDRKYVLLLNSQAAASPETSLLGLPVFFESPAAAAHSDTALCTHMAEQLVRQGLPNIGVAQTVLQAKDAVQTIESQGYKPAIFVVNTYGLKGQLAELDDVLKNTPVLFLRRALFAGRSGLIDQVNLQPFDNLPQAAGMGKLKARLTSMWFYGARNSSLVASRAVEAVQAFLRTNDFKQIERIRPAN